MRHICSFLVVVFTALIATGCGSPFAASPTPTPMPSPTPLATATPQPTVTPNPEVNAIASRRIIAGPNLNTPSGVAVDKFGNVYFADTNNNRIAKFSSSGVYLGQYGGTFGSGAGELSAPQDVVVDAQGNIYVADTGHNEIQKLSPDGSSLGVWTDAGNAGAFSAPAGIALTSAGHIYIADTGNDRVVELSTDGQFLRTIGSTGTGLDHFKKPSGVAVDSTGNIYIADAGNGRIQKLFPNGKPRAVWTSAPSGNLVSPTRVAVAPDGTVYVADESGPSIYRLTSSGYPQSSIPVFGDTQPGSATGATTPIGLAVDPSGNLYDTFTYSGEDEDDLGYKVSPRGHTLRVFGIPIGQPGRLANDASDVEVSSDGHLFITDPYNSRVQEWTKQGRLVRSWNIEEQLMNVGPGALALDKHGFLYVANTPSENIVKISPAGRIVDQWQSSGKGSSTNPTDPRAIATDSQGNVYVVAWDDINPFAYIVKTTPYDNPVAQWGKLGSGPGEFKAPDGIAVGPDGKIYVADSGNARIQILSPDGLPLGSWTSFGGSLGDFQIPDHIKFGANGDIYVSDSGLNVIAELTPTGKLIRYWRGGAANKRAPDALGDFDVGQFDVDAFGNLYFLNGGASAVNEIITHRPSSVPTSVIPTVTPRAAVN